MMQNVKRNLELSSEDPVVHEDLRNIYKNMGVAVRSIIETQARHAAVLQTLVCSDRNI